jgi:DNA-binding transcriptional LysR family regulator
MREIDMRTFVSLARTRHFGRTADEMGATQPAISSRLAALESDFGCRLVHRSDRAFALTAAGKQVLAQFETMLREMEDLRRSLRNQAQLRRAPLRLGAIDSVSATFMPALIDTLRAAVPDLRIELTVDGTRPLVEGMRRGELDMSFCLHPVLEDGFRSYIACHLQMVWAGSPRLINPDRRYEVSELAALPIISFPRDSPPFQMIAPFFHDEQVLASKLTSCNSLYAMVNLLIDGFGIGAIPTVTIRREIAQGLLHSIKVAKRFPPMPIVASYQARTDQGFLRQVVTQAKAVVADYCARVDPQLAWLDRSERLGDGAAQMPVEGIESAPQDA